MRCPEDNRINIYQTEYAPGYRLRPGGYCGIDTFKTVISETNVVYIEFLVSPKYNNSAQFFQFIYTTIVDSKLDLIIKEILPVYSFW